MRAGIGLALADRISGEQGKVAIVRQLRPVLHVDTASATIAGAAANRHYDQVVSPCPHPPLPPPPRPIDRMVAFVLGSAAVAPHLPAVLLVNEASATTVLGTNIPV